MRSEVPQLWGTSGLGLRTVHRRAHTAIMQRAAGNVELDGAVANAILNALTDTVLIIDEMGRLLYVSSDGEVLGHDPDYWVGRSALDVLHPDDLDDVVGHIKAALTSKDDRRRFARIRIGSDGLWFPAEAFGFNRLDFAGTPALLISIRDTTGELWVEQARRRADRTIVEYGFSQGERVAEEVVATLLGTLRPNQKVLLIDVALTNASEIRETSSSDCLLAIMSETSDRIVANNRDQDIVLQVADDRLMVMVRGIDDTPTAYRLAARVFALCEELSTPELSCRFQVGFALASAGDDFADVRFRSAAMPDPAQPRVG